MGLQRAFTLEQRVLRSLRQAYRSTLRRQAATMAATPGQPSRSNSGGSGFNPAAARRAATTSTGAQPAFESTPLQSSVSSARQQEHSKGLFYQEAAQLLSSSKVPLRSPFDSEVGLLFLPALLAGVLEPVQQTAESILVGKLGVPQLGALGLGTVLFQFSVGFLAALIFATTPRVAAHADNKRLASRATAQGMWVALVMGAVLQAVVWAKAPDIIAYMSGADELVASFAVLYLRGRSWGLPAALIMMVAIGAARGVKDMNIPLMGSLAYLLALVAGDLLFLFGPPAMGVEGAGLAAAVAQWVGAATVCGLLVRKQIFDLRDLASPPTPADVAPYVRMTGSLAVNNLSALLPTLVATSLATGLGVQHLGAHTILRQLMGFWLQLFIAFNATAHSLIASSLSRQREARGAQVLARIAQLAVGASLPLAAALFAARGLLPDLFTSDALVRQEVAQVLPLLLIVMPLDALGTVLEGGILGASDTGYLGARTAASCALSLLVLGASALTHGSLLAVWVGMKAINVSALALDLGKLMLVGPTQPGGGRRRAAAAVAPPPAGARRSE